MLDTDTKRRIDTARDILVGKVPDPKSQVEQITIALIYKFMDDMDAEAEELGGKRKFFAGGFARYGWAKLMRSGLGGHETLNLYAEAIAKMPENPGIPPLFRDIFKNAYLPYRDPETQRAFLKIIDEFTYDHSERLLSVLGSEGDAGQFRTPRHIIDFIVASVDPKKTETVLDPACGTAGFLISSYKHILKANTDAKGHSKLTPDDKGRLAQNFKGYDISPDMVRLSLVNLYLHGFTDPHIAEYDTLTSQDKWNEYADVILANPPFMSPKGGIKPHNRFSVQSKRSEVLFVDYMAEHLTPQGRAGIIVPEGIIFQSQTAYTQLRKMLVEEYLVAVVSLPAGVFNPYSGVKTSILILDKTLARQAQTIGFFKIENDGFGLGAQRREIEKNDLPQTRGEIAEYLRRLRARESVEDFQPSLGRIVAKEKIAVNGDYNLSAERYREGAASNHGFPIVSLGESGLFRVESGGTPKSEVEEYWGGGIPWATLVDLPASNFISQITSTKRTISEKGLRESSAKMVPANSVIVSTRATIGRIAINRIPIATNQGFKNVVMEDPERAVPEYVALALTRLVPTMQAWATGGTFAEISKSKFCELQIPLPSLEVQKEIVAEIESYQKVIDGARAVLDNYRPHIPIHPEWPMVELAEVIEGKPKNGYSGKPVDRVTDTKVLTLTATTSGKLDLTEFKYLDEEIPLDAACRCRKGDIYLQRGNTAELVGTAALFDVDESNFIYPDLMIRVRADESKVTSHYLLIALQSQPVRDFLMRNAVGAAGSMPKINQAIVERVPIQLPPLAVQHAMVAEIDAEQALVTANRELITRFETKIQGTLARVWGEDELPPAEAAA
ncbi:MAG: N-6 DNA methylase [Gammaproteobacteria bacterium]|nr:N-6 DNA methylase [Gammaproteobacteria bacterium]